MKLELENVLKFDFYSGKMSLYNHVMPHIFNQLLYLKSYKLINEDKYYDILRLLSDDFAEILRENHEIITKHSNMMDEIFDNEYNEIDDSRSVYGEYITDEKIKSFNKSMKKHEKNIIEYIKKIQDSVRYMSLCKMFTVDMTLLSVMEQDFETVFNEIEKIEDKFGKFEDSLDQ